MIEYRNFFDVNLDKESHVLKEILHKQMEAPDNWWYVGLSTIGNEAEIDALYGTENTLVFVVENQDLSHFKEHLIDVYGFVNDPVALDEEADKMDVLYIHSVPAPEVN